METPEVSSEELINGRLITGREAFPCELEFLKRLYFGINFADL